jgi:hypothetical protein
MRVIFGIIFVIVLTQNHQIFSNQWQLVLEILTLLQVSQLVIIFFIKIIYGIRKLIKNPEEFEVRN